MLNPLSAPTGFPQGKEMHCSNDPNCFSQSARNATVLKRSPPTTTGVTLNSFSMKWSWVEIKLEFIASVLFTLAVCTFTVQQLVEGLAENAFKIWWQPQARVKVNVCANKTPNSHCKNKTKQNNTQKMMEKKQDSCQTLFLCVRRNKLFFLFG